MLTDDTFWKVIGIITLVMLAIGGALWKHVLEDAKSRERTATLETKVERQEHEIDNLREGRHNFREQITGLFAELREEVRRMLDKK